MEHQDLLHSIVLGVCVIIIIVCFGWMISLVTNPAPKTGWTGGVGFGDPTQYDENQRYRQNLSAYLDTLESRDIMINKLSVATANFTGIFTEDNSAFNGSVSSDAARLQVEAGARAVIVDIWPNPVDTAIPIVCTMRDNRHWMVNNLWDTKEGDGHYSNWQQLTRNNVPASDIIQTVLTAAFNGPTSQQNNDPFFLILKLHGAMTKKYLNLLADSILSAIGTHRMADQYNVNNFVKNKISLCRSPVSDFFDRAFVIVIPDINQNTNSLPNCNTYATFIPEFMNTRMAECTNMIESSMNMIWFEPGSEKMITDATQVNCAGTGMKQSLAQTGICVIQPTIGKSITHNTELFGGEDVYKSGLKSGAQFVGVNLFSSDSNDSVLTTFFKESQFGKYSFKKNL